MSIFEYVMIPLSIVLGLAMTHVLTGMGRIVHRLAGHGDPVRVAAVSFVWMVAFFWIYRPVITSGS